MSLSLTDRVALVAGGATRLGREISVALARAGADVAFSYLRSADEAEKTAREVVSCGHRALPLGCDLRDGAQIDAMIDSAAALGPLDLLVFNAGVFRRTPIADATDEDWDFHMNTNARAAYLCARRVGLRMAARGGAIVIIADTAGLRPWGNYVPYSASKAAAIALTRGLAVALAPTVRVNAVAPGPILPPAGADAEAVDRAAARTLLRRHGEPRDIAEAVIFLATAEYVTGVTLPVDGGRHLA